MSQRVFVNLPVKDLKRSKKFFAELGYSFDPHFSDDTAAALKLDQDNTAMLLTHEKFKSFTNKPIPDPAATVGVLVALRFDNKAEVDAIMKKALASGGSEPKPASDLGFMYQRTFADPDGHRWEPFWFDPAAMPQA
jgi:predicted lactoylglutathione lyase